MNVFKVPSDAFHSLISEISELTKAPIELNKLDSKELFKKFGFPINGKVTKNLIGYLINCTAALSIVNTPISEKTFIRWNKEYYLDSEKLRKGFIQYIENLERKSTSKLPFEPIKAVGKKVSRELSLRQRVFLMYDDKIYEGEIVGIYINSENQIYHQTRIIVGTTKVVLDESIKKIPKFETIDGLLNHLRLNVINYNINEIDEI